MPRVTINISEDLLAVLETIKVRERYTSPSEVVHSFLRHWALSQQEHRLTGEWARLSGQDRDALDAGLLKLVKAGKSKKGSWLKAQIYGAIKEAHGADAKSPTIDQVLSVLPDVLRREILNQK